MQSVVWRLVKLASPIAFGRIAIVGMGIVDLIIVGQFAGDELPQLTLAYSIVGPLTIGGMGLMLGVQVLSARAVGAGTLALAGRVWRKGVVVAVVGGGVVWCVVALGAQPLFVGVGVEPELARSGALIAQVLAFSVPFHLLFVDSTNFLEAAERPVPGAVFMWCAAIVNLVLNLLLVPLFGALGSAWTTVAARVFLAASLVGFILLAPSVKAFLARCDSSVTFVSLLAIGGAATVSGLVEAGAFASLGLIAVRISPESLATFSIATGGLLTAVGMLSAGLGAAAAVLVSQETGRHNLRQAQRVGWIAIGLNAVTVLVIGALCALFANTVANAFTSDAEIAALFVGVMWLTAILFTPDLGQMVADPALRARGENWFPTAVRLVAFVGLAPALAVWFVEVRGFDLSGVFWAIIIASSGAYLALLWRWWTLRRQGC